VVVFWLLWREVGVSTLAGVAALAAMMVMMTIFSAKFGVLRAETASISDARIRLTGQIVAGIRTLKIQGWEAPFARQVAAVRAAEIGKIRFTSGLRGVNEGVFLVASILIAAATFLTYTGLGNTLTPRSLWVTMSLFAILQLEAAKFFPLGLEGLSEVRISLRRIQAFLLLPEAGSDGVTPLMDADTGSTADSAAAARKAAASRAVVADAGVTVTANPVVAATAADAGTSIVVDHLTCSWGDGTRQTASGSNSAATAASRPAKHDSHDDDDSTSSAEARAALRDISFTAGAGQLTMVVGPVACGKTSLLMALIGELPAGSGRVTLPSGASRTCPRRRGSSRAPCGTTSPSACPSTRRCMTESWTAAACGRTSRASPPATRRSLVSAACLCLAGSARASASRAPATCRLTSTSSMTRSPPWTPRSAAACFGGASAAGCSQARRACWCCTSCSTCALQTASW
jgi:ATP-binding cassette subfamily C (CFTR/MRP) protein 4